MTRDRAAELRAMFDRGFADTPRGPKVAAVELLRIRLGGEPYAIALAEITAIHADLHVVSVPTSAPELLGVVAQRAVIVPVYDLRRLVNAPPVGDPRWLVIAGGSAFAFDGFDGRLQVAALPARGTDRLVRGVVSHADRLHPVIDLPAVVALVHERWTKER